MTEESKQPKTEMEVVVEATVTAQALSLTSLLVMTQLLNRWALKQKNPSKSIRNMYDAIILKLDSGTDLQAGFEPAAVAEARRMAFFLLGRF